MELVLAVLAIVLFVIASWGGAHEHIPFHLGWLGLAALATAWALLTF